MDDLPKDAKPNGNQAQQDLVDDLDILVNRPSRDQLKMQREMTALYYWLMGPQSILESNSQISRPRPVPARQRRQAHK